MQRIAIIDIGSNSARLVISNIYKKGSYNMVYNQKEALRLAQKVDTENQLTEKAFSSTLEVMHSFAHMCQLYKVDKTIAVATAAIRNSVNGQALVDKIAQETGLQLHIISGHTEAYISYLGVINTLAVKDGIIFDLGGGSTELILFKNRQMINSVSIPFGAVNTTNIFHTRNTIDANAYSNLRFFLATQLAQYPWLKQKDLPLIGVGGTARTVAKIIQREKKYPTTKLHNYTYSLRVFNNFFNKLRFTNMADRQKISGLGKDRNDLILAGCSIINCLLDATGCKEIITSGCGLREGLFYDYYSKTNNKPLISEDILKESRENVLGLNSTTTAHPHHVAGLALTMFREWSQLHKVPQKYERLLETAALLHDIGININYYSHARHSAYMIQNAKLFGLTHKEQLLTSAIAGWHHGPSKNYFKDRIYTELLKEADWSVITRLACILALAEALDDTETQQVQRITPSLTKNKACLVLETEGSLKVELQLVNAHLGWFKKVFGVPLEINVSGSSTVAL